MKGFYKKLVMFLVPVLLVWLSSEVFYRSVENNYTFKTERIASEYEEIETLVLGNSHAFFGINPDYISSRTFNLANVSQSLYFDQLLLERHIDSLPKLKTVVLNISYFSLSLADDSGEDKWRKYFYQQQMKVDVPSISVFDPRQYSLALSRRFNPTVGLFREYFDNGTVVSSYNNGYGMQDSTNIVKDKVAISKIIAKKHEDNSLDFEVNTARLKQMISLCNKREVEVILIQMPVYKTYFDLLNSEKKEKISQTLSRLEANNPNVRYYNFSQNPIFVDRDLRDADHLTNAGAVKFSKLLNSLLGQ